MDVTAEDRGQGFDPDPLAPGPGTANPFSLSARSGITTDQRLAALKDFIQTWDWRSADVSTKKPAVAPVQVPERTDPVQPPRPPRPEQQRPEGRRPVVPSPPSAAPVLPGQQPPVQPPRPHRPEERHSVLPPSPPAAPVQTPEHKQPMPPTRAESLQARLAGGPPPPAPVQTPEQMQPMPPPQAQRLEAKPADPPPPAPPAEVETTPPTGGPDRQPPWTAPKGGSPAAMSLAQRMYTDAVAPDEPPEVDEPKLQSGPAEPTPLAVAVRQRLVKLVPWILAVVIVVVIVTIIRITASGSDPGSLTPTTVKPDGSAPVATIPVSSSVRAAFAAAFARRTRNEWVDLLSGADTCVAPVLDIHEVAAYPQFAARRTVTTATHPTEGSFRQLAPVLAGMDRAGAAPLPDMAAGVTDTDTEHLLKEAGVDGETVARWVDRGVVA